MSAQVPVDAFKADIQILPNGDADIREELTVRLAGGPGELVRQIRFARADNIRFVSASVDGRALVPDASGDVSLTIDQDGPRFEVRWRFASAADAARVLVLQYVAERAVRVEMVRGSVRLEILPSRRSFSIARAELTCLIPDGALLFAGSGIAEAGWRVERVPNGITADRQQLADAESGTVVAELSIDPTVTREPNWQALERSRQFLFPAFVSAGLFMLVIGAGILWIVRFRYPRGHAATPEDERERHLARRGLRNGGLITVVVGLLAAAATWPAVDRLGIWAMALPVSIVIVGAVFAVVSRKWV